MAILSSKQGKKSINPFFSDARFIKFGYIFTALLR